MISSRELKLGKIALRRGMVDKDQIDQCLRLKKKIAKTKGKKVALGALLLKKGYLSKAQLEEIVAIHDKAAAKDGGKDGAERKRSRRSKRATANGAAAPEKEKRRSRSKDGSKRETGKRETSAREPRTDGKKRTSSGKRATSRKRETSTEEAKKASSGKRTTSRKRETGKEEAKTASARTKSDSRKESGRKRRSAGKTATRTKSKRVGKESTKARTKTRSKRSAPSQNGAVDSNVFLSATESAVDTVDKRIVACPSCGKKYRVRPKQVGKRFNCRRCETKIKVPKDLFERELEPESDVDEFTLSGSDVLDSAELQAAAAVAQQSVSKVKRKSIADLAQAAEKHTKKGLGPRTKFGTPQLIMLLGSSALLAVVGYGLYAYSGSIEADKLAQVQAKVDNEYNEWNARLTEAASKIDDADKLLTGVTEEVSGGKSLIEDQDLRKKLANALAEVATVSAAVKDLRVERPSSGDNTARALKREEELGLDDQLRSLLTRQADLYVAMGGYQISSAIDALRAAAEIDTTHVQSQLNLAALLIEVRRTPEALGVLGKLEGEGATALTALATELGGDATNAAKGYAALSDPLGKVLAARAYLTKGDAKEAIDRLAKVDGLDGEELAIAKLIEGYAAEAAGRDATGPYGDAVRATESSPFPRIARGEYYVRIGKPKLAAADFLAANRAAPTARGYVGLGDANLLLLDLEKALRSYTTAINLTTAPKELRLVSGQIDPYARPLASDSRSTAKVRQGMLAWMRGDTSQARTAFQSARSLDPFNPMALAAQAHLELMTKSGSPEVPTLIQEASKLCSGLSAEAGSRTLLPTAAAAYTLLVRAAHEVDAGQPKEADLSLTASERCLDAEPAAISALRIQLYQSQGRDTLAYKESARMAEAETSVRGQLGRVFAMAEQAMQELDPANRTSVDRARTGILACLIRDPYHVRARILLAKLSIQVKEFDTAIATLQRAEEINPYERELYVVRGFLNVRDLPDKLQNGQAKAQAAKDFAFALDLEQRSGGPQPMTLYGQALVFFQQRRMLDAQQKIVACLELDPEFALAYQLQAQVLRTLNKPAEADKAQAKFESLQEK